MAHPDTEALTQALIAVDGIVSTVHMAQACTEDAAAQEVLHGVLLVALSARTLIEDRVEGDPVKEPQSNPYAVMGQADEEVIRETPECDHPNVIVSGLDGEAMCTRCGEDPGNG